MSVNQVAGIGKHNLVKQIKGNSQITDQAIIINESFNRIKELEDLLDLMESINNHKDLPQDKNKHTKDDSQVPEEFSNALSKYRNILDELASKPITKKEDAVSSEQRNNAQWLPKIGGILGKAVVSAAATAMNPPAAAAVAGATILAAPWTIEIGQVAGEEVFKRIPVPELIKTVKDVKDKLLDRHEATRGKEKLQKLMLSPLEVLTPKFISSLIDRAEDKHIILIFEKYETANPILNNWFYYLLDSLNSKIIKKQSQAKLCLIISGRQNLTKTNNWQQWKEDYHKRFDQYSIPYFDESETEKYLKHQVKDVYGNLSPEERKNYHKITCGHPEYLESIYKKIKPGRYPDDSQVNRDITDTFLSGLSPKQIKVIESVSCCKNLDENIIEYLNQHDQKNVANNFDWFDWLKQRDFVSLDNDRYHFDPLPRKLFRRSLFQEDKEQFYRGHEQLAEYFYTKAAEYLPDKPNFAKYSDSEWCEYIGEFLYHACFAQRRDFEVQFLYHLFASSYLNQGDVLEHSFRAINKEANLQDHPFLHDTTKKFLKTLEFVATYSWAAFELDSDTENGKYKDQIADTVLLCKSQWERLEPGIGKVAVLEFILKNLPVNSPQDEDKIEPFEQSLLKEIKKTADDRDPDFSSKLFMQSAFWQPDNGDSSLEWCDKAIEYKPNNANAWYKKGLILKEKARKILTHSLDKEILTPKERNKIAIDLLNEALNCYDRALKIQPFDHRFWQARGDILQKLGEHFLSIERQISELVDANRFNQQDDQDYADQSGTILQQVAYYLRAYDSYSEALRFQPYDDIIKRSQDDSFKNFKSKIEDISNCKNKSEEFQITVNIQDLRKQRQKGNNYSENIENPTFSQLIKKGDRIRLNLDSCEGQQKKVEKLDEALNYYNQAIYKKPEYPLGWYTRGLAKNKLGEIDTSEKLHREAIEDFKEALERKDDLSWAFYDRGIAHYHIANIRQTESTTQEANEEYKNALNDFDRAIRINPDYYNAWYYRGLVLNCLKQYEQAIASYDRAIQICQSNKEKGEAIKAWYDRGRCYADSESYEEAIASYKEAISLYKSLKEKHTRIYLDLALNSYHHWGLALNKLGKYQEANEKYNELIRDRDFSFVRSRGIRFWLLLSQKNGLVGILIREYCMYHKYEDHLVKARYGKGCSYVDSGMYEKAIDNFKEAIDLYPKHIDSWYEYIDSWHEYIDSWYYWGLVNYELEKYSEAINKFKKIIDIDDKKIQKSELASAYYALSKCYEQKALSDNEHKILFENTAIDLDNKVRNLNEKEEASDEKEKNYAEKARENNKNYQEARRKFQEWQLKAISRYKEEIARFEKATPGDRKYIDIVYRYGLALYQLGKYKEAIDKFNKVIKIAIDREEKIDKEALAYYYISKSTFQMANCEDRDDKIGLLDKAITGCEQAINLDNKLQQAYLLLCQLLKAKEIIAPEKINIDSWYRWGKALFELHKYSEANAKFNKTIALFYEHVNAYFYQIFPLFKSGKYQQAVDQFEKLITLFDEVCEIFDKLIELFDKHVDNYLNKGLHLFESNRYQEAIDQFDTAIMLFDELNQLFHNVIALKNKHSDTNYHRGLALFKLYIYPEIEHEFNEVSEKFDKLNQLFHNQVVIALENKILNARHHKGLALFRIT